MTDPYGESRERVERRHYRDQLRQRFTNRNSVFCTTALIKVEDVPAEPEADDIDHVRPRVITPWAISLAAERLFETAVPDEHDLDTDWRLVRYFWWRREHGLLDDQQS